MFDWSLVARWRERKESCVCVWERERERCDFTLVCETYYDRELRETTCKVWESECDFVSICVKMLRQQKKRFELQKVKKVMFFYRINVKKNKNTRWPFLKYKKKMRRREGIECKAENDTQQAWCSTPQSSNSTTQREIHTFTTPTRGRHHPVFFLLFHSCVSECSCHSFWIIVPTLSIV